MSKNQPSRTINTTKKLNLDRFTPASLKQRRVSGTKLSQFAVPNVRRTHSKVKESRFSRDQKTSRKQVHVNSILLIFGMGFSAVRCLETAGVMSLRLLLSLCVRRLSFR